MLALKISRNCVRNRFLRCLLHQSGNDVVLSKDARKVQQHPDELGQNIRSATDTLDVFDALAQHDKAINNEVVMQSLKTLFSLQKSGNSSLHTSQIASHPQFEKLCRDLRRASRSLELNDIIEALKVLSYIGIPSDSNIMFILLNMLRRQINDLSLGHIMFLEFLLKQLEKTPLVEALQIALPMLLEIQLNSQIDHENVPELTDLLIFAANHKISDRCIMNIVSAMTLHGENLQSHEALNVLWALSELEVYKSSYDRLLQNSLNVVTKNAVRVSFDKLDVAVNKCIEKYLLKYDAFYNENFLDAAADHVVKNDVGFVRAMYMQRKFNKINFVNTMLLDYIAEAMQKDPKTLASLRPAVYLSFVSAYSIADYIPVEWDSLKPYVLKNPIIRSQKNELPWMKLSLELLSIDCYSEDLIEKVFDDNFLEHYLGRENNFLDHLQLLALYQCTQTIYAQYNGKLPAKRIIEKAVEFTLEKNTFPLKECLQIIFGGAEYVGTKISTKFGHFIDHVIVLNGDQQPVVLNSGIEDAGFSTTKDIEEFMTSENKVIAILACPKSYYTLNQHRMKGVFQLRVKTLQALGFSVVPINLQQWTDFPDFEKLPYLEREINYAAKKPV